MEDIKEAIGWLSALDTGSEYGETNKEIILSRLEQLEKENEECKLDVQDYLKQAQENAEIYRKAQEKIQDLKEENEELKNKKYLMSISCNGECKICEHYKNEHIIMQKIENKIEELEKYQTFSLTLGGRRIGRTLNNSVNAVIKVLKELLGEE